MKQIGIKSDIERLQLDKDGFAIFPNFLPDAPAKQLQEFFDKTLVECSVDVDFFTTHWSPEFTYRQKVNNFVQQVCQPYLQQLFEDYKCVFGYFLYKKPSNESGIGVHQDWTLIDEEAFKGYIIWIPLTDTEVINGCFHLISGSHKIYNQIRGSNIEQNLPGHLNTQMEAIPVKANSALVIDLRLMHASPPNLSNQGRLAVGMVIVPKDAPLLHYYYDTKLKTTETYRVKDTFLVDSFYDYKHQLSDDYILQFVSND